MVRICSVLAVIMAVSPAQADDGAEPTTTFHKGQLGFSARMGVGVYGIKTYESKYYCGKADTSVSTGNAPVCTGRSPFALDLEASYGVGRAVEVTLELELGFERDFGGAPGLDGPRPLHLAPGARFFFSETAHTKLFAQPELLFDFADYKDAADRLDKVAGAMFVAPADPNRFTALELRDEHNHAESVASWLPAKLPRASWRSSRPNSATSGVRPAMAAPASRCSVAPSSSPPSKPNARPSDGPGSCAA